jgi:prevent-host-death family protein
MPVKTMAAKEAKQSFGQLLDDAQREPVQIERNGRPVAVVISAAEFERFEALEDAYWGRLAEEAEKEGYLGVEESERLLKSYLHAED